MRNKTPNAYSDILEKAVDWQQLETEQRTNARYDAASQTFVGYGCVGPVTRLMPSGKLWYVGFTEQINRTEFTEDLKFIATLEHAAARRGMWLSEGDGNRENLYLSRRFERMLFYGVEFSSEGKLRLRVFFRKAEARSFAATLRQCAVFQAEFLVRMLRFKAARGGKWQLVESQQDLDLSRFRSKPPLYTNRKEL